MNGTIQGTVKVVSGQSGQALQFNETNAAVQNYLAAPFNGSLTLSAWVLTTNTSRSEAIISRYTAAGPGLPTISAPMNRPLGDGLWRL